MEGTLGGGAFAVAVFLGGGLGMLGGYPLLSCLASIGGVLRGATPGKMALPLRKRSKVSPSFLLWVPQRR